MSSRRLTAFAILASLLVHLALVPPAARWLDHGDHPAADSADPEPIEMIMPIAEWILPSAGEIDPPLDEETEQLERERSLGYVRTAQNQESLTTPKAPSFVSDRNTQAQSPTVSAQGPSNMPSVDGDEEDISDLEQRRYRNGPVLEENPTPVKPDPTQAVVAQPIEQTQPPQETTGSAVKDTAPLSQPLPEIVDAIPLPKPLADREHGLLEDSASELQAAAEESLPRESVQEPEQIAAQPPAPPPAPSTVSLPDLNVPSFQSETRKAKLAGAAQRIGDAAFDTKNTPIGRYHKQVGVAVERTWQRNIMAHHDFHSFAKIRVKFTVNRWGKAHNVEILKDKGNAVLTNQTVAAIMQADIPEMPPDVIKLLENGELQCFFNFSIR